MNAFQLLWAGGWAVLHLRIRAGTRYAAGRAPMGRDSLYRAMSPLASFWDTSPWLLSFHHSVAVRMCGVTLFIVASVLYAWSLRHLGANYAPCYDGRLPGQVVRSGPYRSIRHPMYAAKLLVGLATLLTSASLWFVPTTADFFIVTLRTVSREDRDLAARLAGYDEYRRNAARIVPWLLSM